MKKNFVELPIFYNYNLSQPPIGYIQIRKEYLKFIPEYSFAPTLKMLSEAEMPIGSERERATEVIDFSFVRSRSYAKKVVEYLDEVGENEVIVPPSSSPGDKIEIL